MLFGFPTFWMFYVGNMHAPLILALTFIFLAIDTFSFTELTVTNIQQANRYLMAGLLISFFTKPIVLLMLPLLLLLKQTQKTTLVCLGIYAVVSFLFIVVPVLNPEGIGLEKLLKVATDFGFIKNNMNIYQNHFVLNAYMKDNSIHWLNLIAQSDYRLMHVDVFSFPVFIDTLLGYPLNAAWYKLPIYLTILLSFLVPFISNRQMKFQTALLLLMAITFTFFLSYNTVWEYQYASVAPVLALFPVLYERNVFYKKWIPLLFVSAVIIDLPNLYFLLHGKLITNNLLLLIRFNRVIPVVVMFIVMISLIIQSFFKKNK